LLSVPDGVTLKNASEVYPKEEVFFYDTDEDEGSVAVFSDLFRYKLLYEKGGWWVDTDVIYTGHPVPESESFFAKQSNGKVNNAVIKFPEGSKIPKKCIEYIKLMGRDEAASSWGKSGPELLTEVIKEENRMGEARPKSSAYPVSEAQAFLMSKRQEEVERETSSSPFVHLWNAELRRMGIEKDIPPPKGSYLDRCAEELGLDWPCTEVRYSDEMVNQMARNLNRARAVEWEIEKIRSSTTWKVISWIGFIRQCIGFQNR